MNIVVNFLFICNIIYETCAKSDKLRSNAFVGQYLY